MHGALRLSLVQLVELLAVSHHLEEPVVVEELVQRLRVELRVIQNYFEVLLERLAVRVQVDVDLRAQTSGLAVELQLAVQGHLGRGPLREREDLPKALDEGVAVVLKSEVSAELLDLLQTLLEDEPAVYVEREGGHVSVDVRHE